MSSFKNEDIIQFEAEESDNGEYLGWINTGETKLDMIQLERIFPVQFPYSVKEHVAEGEGEAVRITLTPKAHA